MRLKRGTKPKGFEWFFLTQPTAATGEVWERIERYHRHRYPVRVFLQKTFPMWVRIRKRRVNDAIWWVRYRTTNRNHVFKVKSLKPGYYDEDRMMLHMNFDLLVQHVEIGLASKNFQWHEDREPQKLPKFIRNHWPRKLGPEPGLAYLDWEITDPEVRMQSPEQAEHAELTKRLYLWWTVERPSRMDPHTDKRIWEGIDRKRGRRNIFSTLNNRDPKWRAAMDLSRKTLDFYDAQDQAMLELLVSIRTGLWS